jgi:transcription elongation factor/antiterminator RfaH
MTPRLLSIQQAADRLGLTPGSLQQLRWKDDGLPIFQQGLNIHYRLDDLEAFELRELRNLLKQVLEVDRPLPLMRSIARSLDLAVSTQGVENEPVLFKPAPREDLKPVASVKPPASIKATPEPEPAHARDLSLPPNTAWHLVYTKARQEDTAITNLERQGFRCYMPMIYLQKVRRGKSTVISEPMFPSYVFTQLDISGNGQSWSPIRSTLGVRELVKFGGRPARVDAELINALRTRELRQQQDPQALFAPGDKVQIKDGPFVGIEAVYQTTDAEQRSMILISMLSKPVTMRIEPERLRKCG